MSPAQARERFAQFGVLWAIAQDDDLRKLMVFKGGNALDFLWSPNRSTKDLDFTGLGGGWNEDRLRIAFNRALSEATREFGTAYRVQRVHQNPPGLNHTMPTFQINLGFALPDDLRKQEALRKGRPSNAVIKVEISVNECVCATEEVQVGAGKEIQVATLEDIVAEKLRALLQQVLRNRQRPQDLLDIAVVLDEGCTLNLDRIKNFLIAKAQVRDIRPSISMYKNPEVWTRACEGYAELEKTTRLRFIPFDRAVVLVQELIGQLDLMEPTNEPNAGDGREAH